MNILFINDNCNYNKANKYHFSITKSYYLAKSFVNLQYDNKIYFLDEENYIDDNNIIFINTIPDNLDVIIFIRETCIQMILEKYPKLIDYIYDKNCKIIVKSDSTSWFDNKQFKKYIRTTFNDYAKKWIYDNFDIIYCQTKELQKIGKQFFNNDPLNKILISDMAISIDNIHKEQYNNPYTLNHDYCVDNHVSLMENKALYPLLMTQSFIKQHNNTNCIHEFNNKKFIIIYIGRIKSTSILEIMKNMMDILGVNYELHIFPCSFIIPGFNSNKLSAKSGYCLQLLRDIYFTNSYNIIIHHPYQHIDGYKYLYYADCGLDFSQSRPENIKSIQGNAKLLDYASVDLPCVLETNINNSWLYTNENGILIKNIGTVNDYVNGVKMICEQSNKYKTKNDKIIYETWDIRAEQIYNDIKLLDI